MRACPRVVCRTLLTVDRIDYLTRGTRRSAVVDVLPLTIVRHRVFGLVFFLSLGRANKINRGPEYPVAVVFNGCTYLIFCLLLSVTASDNERADKKKDPQANRLKGLTVLIIGWFLASLVVFLNI